MKKVSVEQLFESFANYIVVDLRDLQSFHLYRIPYSYSFTKCYKHLNKVKKTICFVCKDGEQSQMLTEKIPNAVYLEGGLAHWIRNNYDDTILKKHSNLEVCEGGCCEC